jgi:hypothetical protein
MELSLLPPSSGQKSKLHKQNGNWYRNWRIRTGTKGEITEYV